MFKNKRWWDERYLLTEMPNEATADPLWLGDHHTNDGSAKEFTTRDQLCTIFHFRCLMLVSVPQWTCKKFKQFCNFSNYGAAITVHMSFPDLLYRPSSWILLYVYQSVSFNLSVTSRALLLPSTKRLQSNDPCPRWWMEIVISKGTWNSKPGHDVRFVLFGIRYAGLRLGMV